jgi:Zn-dependent metalloprotease/subtilisin-like proprotein convertase family protein
MRRPLIAGVFLIALVLVGALISSDRAASEPPHPEVTSPAHQSPASKPSDPEAIARAYLQQNRVQYGLRPQVSDLDLVYVKESLGAYHVRFQQTVSGIPVFGALTTVNIAKGTDQVGLVLNRYASDVAPVATDAAVSQDQAIAIAQAAVGATELRGSISAEQVYFAVEKSYYLAWQVSLPALDPLGDWAVIVRADTGEVLLKQNLLAFDTGQVFDPNPVQTGAPPPPPPPNDCDSAGNAASLSSEYRSQTLLGIQASQNKLKGDYVDLCAPGILNAYKAACQADEATRSYVYGCNDDRFEEVMVYYHVDAVQRKIQSLGFTGTSSILNKPIPVHAHYYNDCNAFYSPWDGGLHFGDSDSASCTPKADTAEDAEVIVHEYGHAIQDNEVPGWGFGSPTSVEQAKGIGEGWGDFLAAAIYGDPCEAEWVNLGNTACGGQLGLRWLENTKVYPADFNACPNNPDGSKEEHCTGQIWGGALWDLVEALGNNQAARDLVLTLVLDSHFYLDPQSTFAEAASAIRQADIDLYGGVHVIPINSVFAGRGIVSTGPITDFPYAYLRIRHTWIGDLVVTLKVGPNPSAPLCSIVISNLEGGSADDLAGYVDLTGTSCLPYLPPSVATPWWLEAQDFAEFDVGNIADFQVALSGTRRCVATDVPVSIPDNDGAVRSEVDCTTIAQGPVEPFEYDQTDNDSGAAVSSQNFETVYDAFDDQAADDFVVPPSDGAWRIQRIVIGGIYFNGPGPLDSVNVWFYVDAGGLPGAAVFSQLGLVPTADLGGTLILDLPSPPTLVSGTYWLSVQANMDFDPGGQWGWEGRTVQSNSPFAWRNPGDGFVSGCTSWSAGAACTGAGADLLFRLSGTRGIGDSDGDGCTDFKELSMGFEPNAWYDFYDLPVPANDDPTPNGTRDRAVNFQDVVVVIKYVGTEDNGPATDRNVDYDSTKDGDWNGDTVVTEAGDQVGLRYDRSPGPLPNPPYEAGPPDGAVNMQDVTVLLMQVGLDCTAP